MAYFSASRTFLSLKGADVGEHRDGVVLRARHLLDGDPVVVPLEKGRVLRSTRPITSTSPVMRAFMRAATSLMQMNSTSSKCARPFFPVIRLALQHHAHAGLMRDKLIATRADRPAPNRSCHPWPVR